MAMNVSLGRTDKPCHHNARALPPSSTWSPDRSPKCRFSDAEPFGEFLGVDLGVVAAAVVEQHVGSVGLAGQAPELCGPGVECARAVAIGEALVDVFAFPLVRVAVHADQGQ